MTSDTNPTEQRLDEDMPVAPPEPADHRGDAGTDQSITDRLHRDPQNSQARLDRALDESMDASDPPASTQPVHATGPAPSSGYDEEAEQRLQAERERAAGGPA